MQAIVSVVLDSEDEIQSINTSNTRFTFLRKGPILLVSVSQIPSDDFDISILQLKLVELFYFSEWIFIVFFIISGIFLQLRV